MDGCVRRYKLSRGQAETYEWLKKRNINTDNNTLCYWVKTYESQRIRTVVEFAESRRQLGQEIKNIGGWIQELLKSGLPVVDDNCKANVSFAQQFVERTNWRDLRIYEKY